ncbi:HsdM family class I SAM-dependent methyltransferase [Brucella lupini]|uniref:site-specific DNA-methyltransferase (adenine-specific) n=1 Tax=Brucella lupini TaxID=255457 RepID=A0A256H1J9_9HYPH|nr:N-6 DNA methylase [Brucella lupini]KAB2699923.1 N-6 DNA methylase [Brucella lupini]OYR32996.1 N-6 DNA Methylase family protein [Brucella lupini]
MAQQESPAAQSAPIADRLEQVVRLLGLDSAGGLVRSWDEFTAATNHHVVRQAFTVIGVSSVFGFASKAYDGSAAFTPILYLALAGDSTAARNIHRLVWSQGVVPLLLVATPAGLEIRRGLAPPPEQPTTVPWDKLTDASAGLPAELTSLTAAALCSSAVWRDFAIDRSSRVDKALLDGILSLSHSVEQGNTALDRSIVHAVIGRFLYLYVLLDRRIIDADWIASLKDFSGSNLCPTIGGALKSSNAFAVWPAKEVWALFDAIDNVMNGAIFPVSNSQRAIVTESALHLIHRVIRHGDRISAGGRQLSFLDVSFSTLRTETISAIYELFLSLESEDQKTDDGAFYTPPFLVDYVLDETDRMLPLGKHSRVLDPAAGSGIFLVGAFRRILERSLPTGKWTARHFQLSRKLLEERIFGIERNSQAANVCRFSLYLTLLDYTSGYGISALAKMASGERVFPPLIDNIISEDVFEVASGGKRSIGRFTHVVGNPPWGTFGDSATRTNERRSDERQEKIVASMTAAVEFHSSLDAAIFPVANKRLSELFIWKIKRDFLEAGGALGILISTRSFVSRTALAFPNAMAAQFTLIGIANLSHFRYRLFAEARSPTIAIFARNDEPDPMDKVWVYAPLLSSQPIGESGHLWSIIVNSAEVETHRLRDLVRTEDSWFDHLILRPLDRRYARHFKVWTASRVENSLRGFMEKSGLRMLRGGSPAQTGLPDSLLLKAGSYRQALNLDGLELGSYPHDEVERSSPRGNYARLFGGNILLIPRSMNEFIYVKRSIAFSSTFNAIYFEERQSHRIEQRFLSALASYLTSDVARYFYALIGRTWIIDHARLEKGDLEALPFPFTGTEDEALDVLLEGQQDNITKVVVDRIGLDDSFVSAVTEYRDFRSGYEDSQLPTASLQSPGNDEVQRYQAMLSEQLIQSFGNKSEVLIQLDDLSPHNPFVHIQVHISQRGRAAVDASFKSATPPSAQFGQFNPYSTVSYDASTNVISMFKPLTQVAWTMEQAYTDARGISATILRSGAGA